MSFLDISFKLAITLILMIAIFVLWRVPIDVEKTIIGPLKLATRSATPVLDIPLLIECRFGPLPTTVPPEGILHMFVPFRMGPDAKSIGFAERAGQPGEKWEWPKAWTSLPLNSYRCTVTNYGNEPIFSVNLPIRVSYKELIKDPANPGGGKTGNVTSFDDSIVSIPKIDPKMSFVFYTYNQDSDFFEVALAQAPTTYLRAGSTKPEQASILPASQTNFGLWPLPKEESPGSPPVIPSQDR